MKRVAVTIFVDVPDSVVDPVEYFSESEEIHGIVGVKQAYFPPGDYREPLLCPNLEPEWVPPPHVPTLHERLMEYAEKRKALGI